MNYLEEINRFERWLETNYLPAPSQLLWYKLLALFNRCGWAEWITVDNQRLMGLIQCESKNTFLRARNQLLETGLITYRKGKKGTPNQYHLIGFGSKNEPQTKPKTELFMEPNMKLYTRPQTGHINKQKLNNDPPKSPKGETDMFEGYDFSQRVQTKLSEWLRYKQERREGYKPTGLKRFLSRVENALQSYAEADVLEQIDMAMANNWQGIAYDRLKGKARPRPTPEKSWEVPADILESQARQQAALEKLKSGTARLEDLL